MYPLKEKRKLTVCPTGCTQERTASYWLSEKKTFDGRRCTNCNFQINSACAKPSYYKYFIDNVASVRNYPQKPKSTHGIKSQKTV